MKKFYSLLLVLLGCLILAGCNDTEDPGTGGGVTGEVTLSYASWGDANLDALLIAEFEKTHPGVTIFRDTSITGTGNSFTANLVTAAQGGVLPDVFITDNVPTVIENGLVSDVQEYWNKDEDAKLVYSNIANTAVYNGVRYAIPSFQYIKGMLVNKTLLDNIGAEIPSYSWTFEEFKQYCMDYANKAQIEYNGQQVPVQGVNGFAPNGGEGTLGFEQVMPCQDSDTLLYDAYDGTNFNYTDPLWIKYRAETDYFFANGLVESLSAEDKEAMYGASDAYLFQEGVVMFGIEGSWNVSAVVENMLASKNVEIDFYPFPAGKTHQIPVILDYICVSSQTQYPELAFEFAKFMSYGREGWKARLAATKELNQVINGFPVAEYPEIWSELKSGIDSVKYGGLLANIELLPNGVPDCDKWMPGYGSFWGWVSENAETLGFWDMEVDTLAQTWEDELKRQIAQVKEDLGL